MLKKFLLMILLFISSVIMTGCVDVKIDEEITINKDKTIAHELKCLINNNVSMFESEITEGLISGLKDAGFSNISQIREGNGFGVKGESISAINDDLSSVTNQYITITNNTRDYFIFKHYDINANFDLNSLVGDDYNPNLVSLSEYKFTLNLPVKISKTNAKNVFNNNKSATWYFYVDNDNFIHIECNVINPVNLIISLLCLSLIILLSVQNLLRKYSKTHKCPKCGSKIKQNDIYCSKCGYELNLSETNNNSDAHNSDNETSENQDEKGDENKNSLFITIIIVFFIVIISLLSVYKILAFMKDNSKDINQELNTVETETFQEKSKNCDDIEVTELAIKEFKENDYYYQYINTNSIKDITLENPSLSRYDNEENKYECHGTITITSKDSGFEPSYNENNAYYNKIHSEKQSENGNYNVDVLKKYTTYKCDIDYTSQITDGRTIVTATYCGSGNLLEDLAIPTFTCEGNCDDIIIEKEQEIQEEFIENNENSQRVNENQQNEETKSESLEIKEKQVQNENTLNTNTPKTHDNADIYNNQSELNNKPENSENNENNSSEITEIPEINQ